MCMYTHACKIKFHEFLLLNACYTKNKVGTTVLTSLLSTLLQHCVNFVTIPCDSSMQNVEQTSFMALVGVSLVVRDIETQHGYNFILYMYGCMEVKVWYVFTSI